MDRRVGVGKKVSLALALAASALLALPAVTACRRSEGAAPVEVADPRPAVLSTGRPEPGRDGEDVTALGVPSDGRADLTAEIQRLLEERPGRALRFPAGRYRLGGLVVPAGASLVFDDGAVMISASSGQAMIVMRGDGSALRGGRFEAGGAPIALQVDQASDVSVKGSVVSGAEGGGLAVIGSSGVTISDVESRDNGYGILVESSSDVVIEGSGSTRSGRDGILLYRGCERVIVRDCRVGGHAEGGEEGRAGIHAYGSTDIEVAGCEVSSAASKAEAIRFRDTERFLCRDNRIVRPNGAGIAVVRIGDFEGITGGDGRIVGNAISDTVGRAISVAYEDLQPMVIERNTVDGVTPAGLQDSDAAVVCLAPGSLVSRNTLTRLEVPPLLLAPGVVSEGNAVR